MTIIFICQAGVVIIVGLLSSRPVAATILGVAAVWIMTFVACIEARLNAFREIEQSLSGSPELRKLLDPFHLRKENTP